MRKGVSGVTVVRNAVKLGYPLYYTVKSLIDACDEFILSEGYSEDSTMEIVNRLREEYSEKIRVVHDVWKPSRKGETIADVTNSAMRRCTYNWICCTQADEFVHEDNLRFIASVPKIFSRYHSVSFRFTHFFPSLLSEAEMPPPPVRMVRNYPGAFRRTVRVAWNRTRLKIAVRRSLSPLERVFVSFMDIFSAYDAWSFDGNVYPILKADTLKPIFHVGYVQREGNVLASKLESHSRTLYTESPTHKEMAESARRGKLEQFSLERGLKIKPYQDCDYPRLLREWAENEGLEYFH